ncbi:MAG: carbamoyltransferase HypF [Spirochaetaceae bacterium]|nr:MAG: carbamoyltransferase HypF [Spirochaetaceae bacterium]
MKNPKQIERLRYVFKGVIQGVGFRPTVYRCAVSLGLKGFVRNQRSEVVAEIQGSPEALESFPKKLRKLLPPAAVLDTMDCTQIALKEEQSFRILESKATAYSFPPIPPDLATCPECRSELFDAENRRYLYPFITCTQCGPRYSIVEDTPFDRETTSMIDFPQCPDCLEEYSDPANRRFHSQTNSCWSCGPTLELRAADGTAMEGDPILETITALQQGKIVALQGIGGFHLAADPRDAEAMLRIRQDKERERKPFALMVADKREAERLCRLRDGDWRLLSTTASPILIFPVADGAPPHIKTVSHTGTLGIMLPYTPLHLLLFHYPDVEITYRHLVMTSGNLKGEPIISDPQEASVKLAGVADLFLYHNRRILFRTDDSVERVTISGQRIFLRRSRGYVPRLIPLKKALKSTTLAVGADLKNAPALGKGSDIYLAPYIGDLEDPLTRRDFEAQIQKILSLYEVQPEILVHDLHPAYHSTRWALEQNIGRRVGVQHHHAHLLAVMAEHQLEEVIGLSFDGTGYGTDGTIWGGEFMLARRDGFRRLGSFREFGLPGGEAAVLHPTRIALALLKDILEPGELQQLFCTGDGLTEQELQTLSEMIDKGINTPMTSSLGRLFDAASALLGLVDTVSYEGEGPIRLEGLALGAYDGKPIPASVNCSDWGIQVDQVTESLFRLDCRALLRTLAKPRRTPPRSSDVEAASLALEFHKAIAAASLEGARRMRELTGLGGIALSGGVFQNVLLSELLMPALVESGFEVYTHRDIPAGDGGIAVGQVYFLSGNG